ncbi:Reverse transcriptase (RNA-dependent DNA polymerase) [Bacteroidales bacterium Barb4]|nr:Reverse transcriptase (RNA-dependent DNA polymerase) [Bacteroidales bacterium Barb4]
MKVIELNNADAKKFFLKEKSYCSIDLPSYYTFQRMLDDTEKAMENHSFKSFQNSTRPNKPKDFDNVNYLLLINKDAHFGWRPLELIHPVLYVSLVNKICEQTNWDIIIERFNNFQKSKVTSISMPIQSENKDSDKANNIMNWWTDFEQKSIELSIQYSYMLQTDITDCYGSIYTHSIAWALYGIEEAKENHCKTLIGNCIDAHIQSMSYGQTNGIPQGSVLMDFVAELILGYTDEKLTAAIKRNKLSDFEILRYRDDYRIFSNNSKTLKLIAKLLTETLIDLGLKINALKTKVSENIISDSIKSDKLFWMNNKQIWGRLQNELMVIHSLAERYPNSGSVVKLLMKFHRKIECRRKITNENIKVLISIIVDIMYKNPRTYPVCTAILSKFLDLMSTPEEKKDIFTLIKKRFESIPNTGLLDVWLQRIAYPFNHLFLFPKNYVIK